MAKIRITYKKSAIGYTVRQKATIKALGFTHLYQTVEHDEMCIRDRGKGKGSVDHWVAVVKPGRVIFEIADVPAEIALQALRSAGYKLPIKTQVISREEAL